MKKYNNKFFAVPAALAVIGLASCSNELNEAGFGSNNTPNVSVNGVSLVKAPDVVAWSGSQTIGSTLTNVSAYSTRATRNDSYNWNFPAKVDNAIGIVIPENAVKFSGGQGSGTYYISGDYSNGAYFDNNANLTVYVDKDAIVKNIGSNITSLDLYILEGAEVTIEWYSMNNCNIYNEGTLILPKGFDGNKIQNIYNSGSVIVGNGKEWSATLPSDVAIYNKGGYVEFNSKEDDQYSQTLINGTIISDNIVKSKGKIKFQSIGYRDLCKLISTDLIEITDGTNIFGEIEGTDIKFDGEIITLHPEGYVYASNEINMPNSGCRILAYDSDSRGLVECKTLNVHFKNDPLKTAIGEGIYIQVEQIIDQTNGSIYTDFSSLEVGSPSHINQGVKMTPACTALADENDKNDDVTETPQDPSEENTLPLFHNHEVEVNYAILDDHGYESGIEDLVTKLSIHVRYATNVDVKIPIPTRYIIESDDLYIFNEHYSKPNGEYEGAYGGESYSENPLANQNATLSYPITNADGSEVGNVILHVDFERGDENLGDAFAEGYIHVWTEGITEEVINACWAYNKDGINFEIFNYFQTEKVVWNEGDEFASVESASDLNRTALIEAMNQSVISFEFQPDYYINAFGYAYENGEKTEEIHPDHATVVPAEGEGYREAYRTNHLNSTPYNDIYVHESVEKIDDLHQNLD